VRSGNKNKLLPEHQKKILDAFTAREDIEHFACLMPNEEIGENDYNIAVSSYVEQKNEREEVDIKQLNANIVGIVARQAELRTQIDAIVAELEGET
jgi:type I restriction enzyme M protein